jgi:carbamoyl-phosphate synthase large subunit
MKRILVTGAGGSAAANFIKCLRMADEDFYLVGSDIDERHLALCEGLDAKYLVPRCDDPSYIKKINQLVAAEKIEFLHPQPDVEVSFISENREKFKAKTYLPSQEAIRICQSKIALAEGLREAEVPVPESYLIENEGDLESAVKTLLPKAGKVWLRAIRGAGSKASLPITEFEHGKMWIGYWAKMKGVGWGDFMACEFLPGREFAFQSIWRNGEIVTSQARERLEYFFGHLMPSGQTSTPSVARTVHRDDVNQTTTAAVKLVDSQATGVFCADIKENVDGVPCVTEINAGRFFTTSNFFAEAGSNMPYYYVKMAYGEELPDLPEYSPIPENWYWIRNLDMGHKLVKGERWEIRRI